MKKKSQTHRFICRTVAQADNDTPANLCLEASAAAAGQALPVRTLRALACMSPEQQVNTISIMLRQDNLSGDFARALLAATPANMRADDRQLCRVHPDCNRRLARIIHRLVAAQHEADILRARHDENLLALTLTAGWARTWIRDDVIASWLASHRPASLAVLERIVDDADFAVAARRHMKLPYQPASAMAATHAGTGIRSVAPRSLQAIAFRDTQRSPDG